MDPVSPAEQRSGERSIDASVVGAPPVTKSAKATAPASVRQLPHQRKTEKQLLPHEQHQRRRRRRPQSNNKHSPHSQSRHHHDDGDGDEERNGGDVPISIVCRPSERQSHVPACYESFTSTPVNNNIDEDLLMTTTMSVTQEEDHENHNLVHISDHDEIIVKYSLDKNSVTISPSSTSKSHSLSDEQDDDRDTSCGILSFRPGWLQSLANKHTFMVIFSLTSIFQGMYFTYFVSVLTTIEKLFQMQSRTTGFIMSATEIGQICGALLLTYYGGQGHRPRWISAGMIIFASACFLCATPHFLFGGQSLLSQPMQPVSSSSSPSQERADFSLSLCLNSSTVGASLSDGRQGNHKCEDEELRTAQSQVTTWVLSIFFTSLCLIGIGTTAVNTLAIPYIDDNVAPRDSPLYFGITIGIKIFGPVFGFMLGSICTSIYVDFPFANGNGLVPSDPQWISAWWMGILVIGVSLLLTSIPMMAFPKKLPSPDPSSYCHRQQQQQVQMRQNVATDQEYSHTNGCLSEKKEMEITVKSKPKSSRPCLKDFPAAVARLLSNRLLLLRTASSVLHILPIAGLYTFLPKYLESQFQLTASRANMISGVAGILVMGIGIFASGIFMRTFKPSARFVAAWIAGTALMYGIGMMILMFLGCDQKTTSFAGLGKFSHPPGIRSTNSPPATCGSRCSCPSGEFSPICTDDGVTYISPCLAGCSAVTTVNLTFTGCSCLQPDISAVHGYCPVQCDNLTWYIIVFASFVLIHSTSEVGSMLLTLRCVQPQDKAMALGLVSFSISLFGNVPCPIVYGVVVDSACLFWEKTCGEAGACRLYDTDRFRFAFHGMTAIIMFVAFFVDLIVCRMASDVRFDDDGRGEDGDHKTVVQSNGIYEEKA